MRHVVLILSLAVLACQSTSGLTPEQKQQVYLAYLAEAKVYVEESRLIADVYVEAGRLDQADVNVAYAAIAVVVPILEAAIQKGDPVAMADARARVVSKLAHLALLLAVRDAEPDVSPPDPPAE